MDDQALFADCEAGLVVILGCAHSGVIDPVEYVTRLTARNRVDAVIGGMHLMRASRGRIEATADTLETYGVEKIAPCHCTGSKAISYFWSRFGGRGVACSMGTRFLWKRRLLIRMSRLGRPENRPVAYDDPRFWGTEAERFEPFPSAGTRGQQGHDSIAATP